MKSLRPPVSGIARIFFRRALRRSSLCSIASSSGFLAATTAPIYFTKLIPHFSHFTPVRCLLPQEGQSKRIVIWQRWQKRATSRTAAPHFGQGIVAWGTAGAAGSHAFAEPVAFARTSLPGTMVCALDPSAGGFPIPSLARGGSWVGCGAARGFTSETRPGGLPPFCPEDELPVIAHLNGAVGSIRPPCQSVHRQGNPVRRYR